MSWTWSHWILGALAIFARPKTEVCSEVALGIHIDHQDSLTHFGKCCSKIG